MRTVPHQVLVVTLTLFQLEGLYYAHHILMSHQVLKATGVPGIEADLMYSPFLKVVLELNLALPKS